MKNLLALSPFFGCLFFLGCGQDSTSSTSSLVPQIEVPGSKSKPVAYAKTIALPKLIEKAVEVANVVKPGAQSAMIPMMAGMVLGDPALVSVDPDAPLTVLLFDNFKQSELTFVLAMKLNQTVRLQDKLKPLG